MDGKTTCRDCGWPICSQSCPFLKLEHAQSECQVYRKAKKKVDASSFNYSGGVEPLYDVIFLLRLQRLKETCPGKYRDFFKLESHLELWKENADFEDGKTKQDLLEDQHLIH